MYHHSLGIDIFKKILHVRHGKHLHPQSVQQDVRGVRPVVQSEINRIIQKPGFIGSREEQHALPGHDLS